MPSVAWFGEFLKAWNGCFILISHDRDFLNEQIKRVVSLELEGLRIPHFYHAFYVYKYATGVSAAIALAERALTGVPGAVEAYLDFLKSGGSKFPLETLQTAGVDMRTSAPVESTLRLFDRRVTELEGLL